jgi:hypothetical protein
MSPMAPPAFGMLWSGHGLARRSCSNLELCATSHLSIFLSRAKRRRRHSGRSWPGFPGHWKYQTCKKRDTAICARVSRTNSAVVRSSPNERKTKISMRGSSTAFRPLEILDFAQRRHPYGRREFVGIISVDASLVVRPARRGAAKANMAHVRKYNTGRARLL